MAILEIANLEKSYGKTKALRGIDLKIEPWEVYGFIGPNGAGKTTTIRVLLGILKADKGSVKVFGQDAWRDAVNIHKKIAYVPGEVNLWSNLTGGEVIDLFVRLRGSNNKNRRKELIERFDLDPSKKCRSYSKGNRQKVALIAAFAAEAELYILDEPTSGLDPLMERVFQACIREVKADGKSVLLSSHILSEVEKLCDKVSIIREGSIIESGSIEAMRHLTGLQVTVQTKKPLENLNQISGIRDLAQTEKGVRFQVDIEAFNDVLAYLQQHEVQHLISTPPTLEDLFMHHYSNAGGDR